MRFLLTCLVLTVTPLSCWATSCDFKGGFTIRRPGNCGQGFVDCDGGPPGVSRCCPNGSHCMTLGKNSGNAYCCPTAKDCIGDLINVPKCPSNGTALWIREEFLEAGNLKNSFCCDDDWFGVDLNNGGGSACSRRGASLATNEATAEQYTRTASICTEATSATTKHDTTTSDPTETASTGSSSEDNTDGDEASISGGAIAGIVIGSIAGVGLLGAAAFWIFRRRSVLSKGEQKSEYATAQQWNYVASEMDARPVYELPGKEPRRELDADTSRMT